MKNKIILYILSTFLLTTFCHSQKLNTQKLDSLFQILETKNKYMGSIAISENGKIIYTKSIGKDDIETNKNSSIDSKYRIGSISKVFTSALIFKAVEEKKLTLEQNIVSFFPQIKNASKITIGNLLNHRSGIHNFTNDETYLTYNTQPKSEKEMLAIIENGGSDFEPNSKPQYSNSNYVLLSYILEKVYKKPYPIILNEKIIKPLGLKQTYFGGKINLSKNEVNSYDFEDKWIKQTETDASIPLGAGAIVSNPTDLVYFIEQLFGGKIIKPESLNTMKTIKDGYGMGIFEAPFYDKKGYTHTGGIDGFSSVVAYFPSEKLAVALTSNGNNYKNNDILIAALSSYFGKSFEIPTFKTLDLKTEDLDLYLGTYASPTFPMKITISKEKTTLLAQATGQSSFPLTATKKDIFEFEQAGIVLEFNPVQKEMTLKQGGGKFMLKKE